MKRIQVIMSVALAVTFFTPNVQAESPLDGIGRGRLLRKWLGSPSQQRQPQPKKQSPRTPPKHPTPAQQNNRQTSQKKPTQSRTPQMRYPTPTAANRANLQTRKPAQNAPAPKAPRPNSIPSVLTQPSHAETAKPKHEAESDDEQAPEKITRSSRLVAQGFGMEVEQGKDEKFYVTQVYRDSNAVKAGIQRGDILVDIGGTELESIQELNEITKILGQGDHLEFQMIQNGKEKEVMVQFGKAKPAPKIVPGETESPKSVFDSSHGKTVGDSMAETSVQPTQSSPSQGKQVSGRYDFVPQPSTSEYRSVLQKPGQTPPTRPASWSRIGDQPKSGVRSRLDDQSLNRTGYGKSILIRG